MVAEEGPRHTVPHPPRLNRTRSPPLWNASEGSEWSGQDEEVAELYQMSSFYCACIMVSLCLIGLVGNWLSVYVFSRKSMRCSSINVLLTGLSATDFLLLLIVVPIFALPPLASQTGSNSGLDDFTHYMIAYVYPLAVILQTASVWIFMLITVERWLAVCLPLQVGQYCTVGRSRSALAAVYAAAVGYNLVRFWEYTTEACPDSFCGSVITVPLLRASPTYWLWYGTVAYLLTQFLLPFLTIAIFNGLIIVKMYQARKRRALLSSSEKSEHRTAVMMIIVVVVFASCYSLSFVLNFHEALDPELFYRQSTSAMAYLLNDVSNTLVVLNSACTFLVYLGFSRRYRYIARWTFLACLPKPLLNRWCSDETLGRLAHRKSFFLHSVIPKHTIDGAGRARTASTAARVSTTYALPPLANGRVPHIRRRLDSEPKAALGPAFKLQTASEESLISPAGRRPSARHRYLPLPVTGVSCSRSCDQLAASPEAASDPPSLVIRNGHVGTLVPHASPELSLVSPSVDGDASSLFQEDSV